MVRSLRGSNLEHCVYAHLLIYLFIVIQWALIKGNSFFPMHYNIVKYSEQIAVSGSTLQLSGSNLEQCVCTFVVPFYCYMVDFN